jgi:hypothetical protein
MLILMIDWLETHKPLRRTAILVTLLVMGGTLIYRACR